MKTGPAFPKVRMALVGLRYGANVGREIIRQHQCGIEIVALCDRDARRAAQISKELGLPILEWEAVLSDPAIEAVGLFTGPVGRAGLIQETIRAGKDVLTTKPFELDPHAARDVLAEAQRLGRIIHLNSPGPVPAEDIRQVQDWCRTHQLGRPVAMRAETWAANREKADGSWYDDLAVCGPAPVIRLGIYFLNEFAALMGEPESVHLSHSRFFTGRPTADNAQVSIRYENGALGNVFASFCVRDGRPYQDAVTLNFENGTIRRWLASADDDSSRDRRAVLELSREGVSESIRMETGIGQWCGWYQWDNFQQAVRHRKLLTDGDLHQILYGVRLLEAIGRSFQTGHAATVLTALEFSAIPQKGS